MVHGEGPVTSTGTISCCLVKDGQAGISRESGYIFIGQPPLQKTWGVFVWGAENMDTDPLFADPNQGDFHLKSQGGRWEPVSETWVIDDVTSPCIDAGDPMAPIELELFPNGGRINMGVYGGTVDASKSYFGEPPCKTIIAGDINGDCRVDVLDLSILASHWLEKGEGALPDPDDKSSPSDGSTDGGR
jgi:hypothetical protein